MASRNKKQDSSVIVEVDPAQQKENEEFQDQVEGAGDSAHDEEGINPVVTRRLKALRKLQFEVATIEGKFYEELQCLEAKYATLYSPVFEKRGKIVKGEHEPTDEECDLGELAKDLSEETAKLSLQEMDNKTAVSGIPDFWVTVFSNVDMLFEATFEKDFLILKHLCDIKSERFIEPQHGFKITFYFNPNEYFTNSTLTKTYLLKSGGTPDAPYYQGPMVNEWIGSEINWYQNKNVTEKEVVRRQRHKKLGTIRTTKKMVKAESFFNFFNPSKLPEADDTTEISDTIRMELMSDFEMGQYIVERVIPKAYLFYTGEVCQTDCEDDDEEDEEEDDSSEQEQECEYNSQEEDE